MKPALLLTLLICVLLTGCGSHSSATIDDAAVTAAVKAKLAAEFGPIEARQERQFDRGATQQMISFIEVKSVNGVVTLTGEVRSKKAKARAGEIASGVDHVVSVNNNLAMAPGYSDDAVGEK